MKYNLIASRTTYCPNSYTGACDEDHEEEIVATFSTRKLAEEYVKKCKLKEPKKRTWQTDLPFRAKTLLGNWSYVEISPEEEDIPSPHDPEV